MNAYFKPIELLINFLRKHPCFDPFTGEINNHERYTDDLSELEHIFSFFNVNVADFIFYGEKYKGDLIYDENWKPLLSFYLDIKVKQHILRMRHINGYLPIQQLFEEYLSALKWGVEESFLQDNNVIMEFDVFRLINNYKQSNNSNEIENQINQKLFNRSLPIGINREFIIPESKIVLHLNRTSTDIIVIENFNTVGDLLNYIYMFYLKNKVSPSSYGKEWIIFQLRTYEVLSWKMNFREQKINDLDLLWKKEIVLLVLQ
jgi:hypothetical protein